MRLRSLIAVAVMTWLAAATSAHADLLSRDSSFGAGTITRDTQTHLDWLDLTLTNGMSFDEVERAMQPGGTFAGWRFGERWDVETLGLHAGLNPPWGDFSIKNAAPAKALIELLGSTFESEPAGIVSLGIMGPASDGGGEPGHRWRFASIVQYVEPLGGRIDPRHAAVFESSAVPGYASWLIREVPEPATAVLLLAGAAVVGCVARRERP